MNILILIIEDDPENALLTERILKANGWAVATAPTGREGLRILNEMKPDIILLDINLPDISGYQVVEAVRAHADDRLANTPILAVTANALVGDSFKTLTAGCDGYISKPYDIQDLVTRVRTFIRMIRGTRALL